MDYPYSYLKHPPPTCVPDPISSCLIKGIVSGILPFLSYVSSVSVSSGWIIHINIQTWCHFPYKKGLLFIPCHSVITTAPFHCPTLQQNSSSHYLWLLSCHCLLNSFPPAFYLHHSTEISPLKIANDFAKPNSHFSVFILLLYLTLLTLSYILFLLTL